MRALLVLFAAWLLSLGLARAAPLIPGLGQADAVYGDGEAVYVARGAAVYRVSPGQAPVLEEIPGWGEHRTAWLAGSGSGPSLVLVLWSADGRVARRRGGVWQTTRMPRGKEDCFGAVDSAGRFACAGPDGTLQIWEDDRWLSYPVPKPGWRISGLTPGPAGSLLLVAESGEVLQFASAQRSAAPSIDPPGRFTRYRFPGMSREAARERWGGGYYSALQDKLYVGCGRDLLLRLDLATGEVVEQRLHFGDQDRELPASPQSIRGGGRKREVLFLRGAKDVFVIDSAQRSGAPSIKGGKLYLQPPATREHDRYLNDAYLDGDRGALYLAASAGVFQVKAEAPVFGQRDAQPTGRSSMTIVPIPTLRLALGSGWGVAPTAGADLHLDVSVGALILRARKRPSNAAGLVLHPQLGYSFNRRDEGPRHLFVLGMGAGYGNPLLAFTYGPRLIAGGDGVGVRHGLMVHTLYDLLSLEVSHQVSFGAPTRQEVRLMIGVNAVPLAVGTLALLVGAFFTGSFAKALRQL